MYDKLTIKNFQSHKNTTLEFHSGVNAIVGVTDSGKSVIRRALEWVSDNQPSGSAFCSHWGGTITRVSLTTNGKRVSRIKRKGKDLYKIDKQVFKSFGRKVPPEVQEVLNMRPDNVQTQLKSLFLLNDSPGKVALHYNDVADLGQINEVRDSLQKDINGFSQTVKYNDKEIEKSKKALKEYSDLDKIEKELNAVVRLETQATKEQKEALLIQASINSISDMDSEIGELKEVLDGEELVDECLLLFTEMKDIVKEILDLGGVITVYDAIIDKKKDLNELAEGKEKVDAVLSKLKTVKQLDKDIDTLTELLSTITLTDNNANRKQEKLTELNQTYKKEFRKLKRCFFCNSKLK